jgi:hypothetical protein
VWKWGKQASREAAARKKFRRAAYDLYVSKKFFTQRNITSDLAVVFRVPGQKFFG